MENLFLLREQLGKLTQNFFSLLNERKKIVTQIQKFKEKEKRFYAYCPEQEVQLFLIQKDLLSSLSLRELLAYSLIMEEHANVESNAYPQWSQGEHLQQSRVGMIYQINPILLAVTRKELYDALSLNEEFKTLMVKYVAEI